MYWDMVHAYLARLLAEDACVRDATMVIRFETICDAPAETLRAILKHAMMPDVESIVERQAPAIRRPACSGSEFTPGELAVIHEETAATARLWGY
jgi:hypothetical protein